MTKAILFVEKQNGVIDAIIASGCLDECDFVFGSNHVVSSELSAALNDADLSTEVLSYESVDLLLDQQLKLSFQKIASEFVSGLTLPTGECVIPETAVSGVVSVIRDLLFVTIRPYLMLAKQIRVLSPSRVLVVAAADSNHFGIDHFLREIGVQSRNVLSFDKSALSSVSFDAKAMPGVLVPDRFTPRAEFKSRIGEAGQVVVISSAHDARSASLILPIVSGLQSRASVTLALHGNLKKGSLTALKRNFGVSDDVTIVQKARVRGKQACDADLLSAMTNSIKNVQLTIEKEGSPVIHGTSALILDSLAHSASVIDYARVYDKCCKDTLPGVAALVVSPSGVLDALIAVENAKSLGIPTIEIQRGPVATETVVTPPRAQHVLCIDEASKEVYSGHCKHPSRGLHVVGSLKLDVDMGPWRFKSQQQARAGIPGLDELKDAEIILLVGQPIDRSAMREVASIVMRAAVQLGNIFVLVKPHPEEDLAGREMYRKLARDVGLDRYVITDIPSAHCVLASDYVATYYSTVGLEGLSLGKPVISINPFSGRSPFDLTKVGLAHAVLSSDQLASLLRRPETLQAASCCGDTTIFRDGGTNERIVNFILEKAGQAPVIFDEGARVLSFTELRERFNVANAEDGPERAIALLSQAVQFSERERKMLGAYAELDRGNVSAALKGFSYRTLVDKTVSVPPGVEPWLGQKINGRVLVWAQTGIGLGAEVMHMGYLPALRSIWSQMLLVCDDRLVPLAQKSFPGLPVKGRLKYEAEWSTGSRSKGRISKFLRRAWVRLTAGATFDYHCTIMSLGLLGETINGSAARCGEFIRVDGSEVQRLRDRYAGPLKKELIGITWKTTNTRQVRRNVADLKAFVSVLSSANTQLVSLQHGPTDEEIEMLRGIGVIVDEEIDPVGNVPSLFNQVGAMDFVISVPNSIGHIAGSVGVPAVLIVPNGSTPEWQTDTATRYWYPTVETIRYHPHEFDDLVRTRLPELVRNMRSLKRSPIGHLESA